MQQKLLSKIQNGFAKFRNQSLKSNQIQLSKGQNPHSLVIACSDSRVDPSLLFSSAPGELFVVRNIANLVPPFEQSEGLHGVSAAIEFGVRQLQVQNLIVLGHRQCGGVRALMTGLETEEMSFVHQWMKIGQPAKDKVLNRHSGEELTSLCRHAEKEAILLSLTNLESFPFVQEAQKQKKLSLLGLYFDLESEKLHFVDRKSESLQALDEKELKASQK